MNDEEVLSEMNKMVCLVPLARMLYQPHPSLSLE